MTEAVGPLPRARPAMLRMAAACLAVAARLSSWRTWPRQLALALRLLPAVTLGVPERALRGGTRTWTPALPVVV
eukprot:14248847-Alexandrium_andersonii.AAC.1